MFLQELQENSKNNLGYNPESVNDDSIGLGETDYEQQYREMCGKYDALNTNHDNLKSEYDELENENGYLKHELKNQNMAEVIEDIHSLIGNGISAGNFRKIADMLSTKYHIKEQILGLDYGI